MSEYQKMVLLMDKIRPTIRAVFGIRLFDVSRQYEELPLSIRIPIPGKRPRDVKDLTNTFVDSLPFKKFNGELVSIVAQYRETLNTTYIYIYAHSTIKPTAAFYRRLRELEAC